LFKPAVHIIIPGIIIILTLATLSLNAGERPLSDPFIHHDLRVVIYPQEHRFTAEDTVTIPDHILPEFRFFLHKGLNPASRSKGVHISKETGKLPHETLESYKVRLGGVMKTLVLSYGGMINHPLEQVGKEQARGYSQTMGKIADEGIYLSGNSYWYPVFDTAFVTFSLQIELPRDWDAVSQGERTLHKKDDAKTYVRWTSPEPQEEIFLVAGKFYEYVKSIIKSPLPPFTKGGLGGITHGEVQAMVFLRSPDQVLADKYLDATVRYITMYEKLIGPYPYEKFALVENFWETGFGMPSFTLLGPKVIRFPFIINTSYPHEILHTWWGNSVFPDYAKGNWAEGLTAYLSDHLNAEQQGGGADYRQTTLQKYADYVSGGKDFPLTEFRSRHSSSSEAIGYGKSLMFFHMIRLDLGDEVFIRGLQDFYRKNRFHYASFHDLRRSFEEVSVKDLRAMFEQWTTRTGAPEVKISNVQSDAENDGYVLTAVIEQVQKGQPYHFRLPLALTMEGREQTYQTALLIDRERFEMKLTLPSRPLRIDFDPEFDVFRRLNRNELPPAITQVLGAKKLLVILPSSSESPLLQSYRTFAGALSNAGPDQVEIKLDSEISHLPSDRAICILDKGNRYFPEVIRGLSKYQIHMNQTSIQIENSDIPFKSHSIVLTGRNPENQNTALLFVTSENPEALKGLSRKLPHYHKYSYLGFRGDEPENIVKGRWPVTDSPMTVFLPDKNAVPLKVDMGRLIERKPLAPAMHSREFSSEKMMETIRFLASDELKGRALGSKELDQAAEYIAQQFREAGLRPAGDSGESYFQTWEEIDNTGHKVRMKIIVGVIPGMKPEWSSQSVVIGAHYDHLGISVAANGKEQIYHGADDNASGVSIIMELAQVLSKTLTPDRSVIFIAFTGEESGRKGSKHYVTHQQRYPKDQIMGMLNIDTVGRLDKNKLLILGSGSAKEWGHIFKGASHMTGIGIEMISDELDSSDQKSFQEAGIPAVQFFSGPHFDYHKPTDTEDKINAGGLAKVASVAKEVIEYLARRQEPLTATITTERNIEPEPKKERKVSFGIIPDFGHSDEGCRISGVVQGSPAEKAGLREGDIIIKINTNPVRKLKDLSDILKSLLPGDKVFISFLREGKEMTAETELKERQ
jgi:aminopeptidase N